MNPTMTLAAIRAAGPCGIKRDAKTGWNRLIAGLGYEVGKYDPGRLVSLGDIATTNDAADALWCLRCLDWGDIAIRRAVIGKVILPAVRRAAVHTKDSRVHDGCIAPLERWCAGDDTIDFEGCCGGCVGYAEAATEAVWAAMAAAWAALAAEAAEAAGAAVAEQQRCDIIAAFPPVALGVA